MNGHAAKLAPWIIVLFSVIAGAWHTSGNIARIETQINYIEKKLDEYIQKNP